MCVKILSLQGPFNIKPLGLIISKVYCLITDWFIRYPPQGQKTAAAIWLVITLPSTLHILCFNLPVHLWKAAGFSVCYWKHWGSEKQNNSLWLLSNKWKGLGWGNEAHRGQTLRRQTLGFVQVQVVALDPGSEHLKFCTLGVPGIMLTSSWLQNLCSWPLHHRWKQNILDGNAGNGRGVDWNRAVQRSSDFLLLYPQIEFSKSMSSLHLFKLIFKNFWLKIR